MTVATDTSTLIAKKIKELPPLPLVVRKLIQVTDDDNSNANDVQEVLSSDQALVGKILKLVNSSFYGMSGEVSTISRAIVILGFAAIRNLATGLGVAGIMAQAGKGSRQEAFWSHAIATASAAQVLANHTGYEDPEEAFIAGLLHDIGHLILAVSLPKPFSEVMDSGPFDLLEKEQSILGTTHTRTGQKLLRHWKLPNKLVQAVRFHHNLKVATSGDDDLTPLIALADAIAGVQGLVYERSLDQEGFAQLVKVTGLDITETKSILEAIEAKIEETQLFLKIATEGDITGAAQSTPPSRRMVMLCTDPLKATWTQQVMAFFGHTLMPMKDFFAAAGQGEAPVDLIILDQGSITPDQLGKMKPVLDLYQERLVAFGDGQDQLAIPALGIKLPVLPLAFSRFELEQLIG